MRQRPLRLGPRSARLLYNVARIHAKCPAPGPQRALELIQQALEHASAGKNARNSGRHIFERTRRWLHFAATHRLSDWTPRCPTESNSCDSEGELRTWFSRDSRWSCRLPVGEWLERRTLLALTPLDRAVPLQFGAFNDAEASHFLSDPNEFDLYSLSLQKGDTLIASLSAQQSGSGLAELCCACSTPTARPLALDNQQGGDPQLSFQAAVAGQYYLGVSSAPDNNYNPTVNNSGIPGATTGLYRLDVKRLTSTPVLPDLTGSSFRTGLAMAAPNDVIPVSFTVENRGGADPGNFQVQVLLGQTNLFDATRNGPRDILTGPNGGRHKRSRFLVAIGFQRDDTGSSACRPSVPGHPHHPRSTDLRLRYAPTRVAFIAAQTGSR